MKRIVGYLLIFTFAISAVAIDVEHGQAMYTGGTIASLKEDTMGRLDTTSDTALTFEAAGTKIVIPYEKIESFQYSRQLARHLGVVATVVVVMVKHRQRRHFIKIAWTDPNAVHQVAVFEVAKDAPRTLQAILQARVPELCKTAPKCGFQN